MKPPRAQLHLFGGETPVKPRRRRARPEPKRPHPNNLPPDYAVYRKPGHQVRAEAMGLVSALVMPAWARESWEQHLGKRPPANDNAWLADEWTESGALRLCWQPWKEK